MSMSAMLPPLPFYSRRIAMTAMIDMKLTFSDAFAAFAAILSLSSILYVLHVVVALF
jgi:hypothetical protein